MSEAQTKFDARLADAQGTPADPVEPAEFDFDAYAEYEASLDARAQTFRESASGVLVYRRFRVPETFSAGCRDMRRSLALQLGALQASMRYQADLPNFLEPWYGIGTVASAFGVDYVWPEGQAPALKAPFQSVAEALDCEPAPVERTEIGRRTLEMIEYFMEATGGRLPISPTDTQSPLNTAAMIVPTQALLMDLLVNPDGVRTLLDRLAGLLADFTRKQLELLGGAAVWPGHGFGSCRWFKGLGMSDDTIVMLSPDQYRDCAITAAGRAGAEFGGIGFHSCGDWSARIEAVKTIPALRMVDGAFTAQTDPDPNPPEPFGEAFAGTGVAINARMVGGADAVARTVRRLWRPGLKLIVATYCKTPAEQDDVYRRIRKICP